MRASLLTASFVALAASMLAVAHPGEEHHHDESADLARRFHATNYRRSLLKSCGSSIERRHEIARATHAKREAELAHLRRQVAHNKQKKRSLANSAKFGRRQAPSESTADAFTEEVLSTDHESNRTDISLNITNSDLFDDASGNSTCLLQPEATIGPYWVAGEYVRDNITEDQQGVPLYMRAQFLDVDTCEPIEGVYWELWHCNATGVYSGIQANSNGNYDDASNLNATFLRGMAATDEDGVASVQSIFPGHYTGRAPHIHVVVHQNATVLANNTIGTEADNAIHIGQLFFDQDLISSVEKTSPYTTNTQELTLNANDTVLTTEAQEGSPDPVFEYALLGDDVSDGIFAWVSLGINSTASYETTAAATLYSTGGVESESSSMMGPGGGGSNSTSGSFGSSNSTSSASGSLSSGSATCSTA